MSDDSPLLTLGTRVEIQGLVKQSVLNGEVGIVRSFSEEKGRYTVSLGDGRGYQLKATNLRVCSPTSMTGEEDPDLIAISAAVKSGQDEIVRKLFALRKKLEEGPGDIPFPMSQNDLNDLLFVAVSIEAEAESRCSTLKMLVQEFGAHARARHQGKELVHLAARIGSNKLLALLAELGADVTVGDSRGITPVVYASAKGHTSTVRLLIKDFGVDSSVPYANGRTCLHEAAASGHEDTVRLLVYDYGANVDTRDVHNIAPVHCAAGGNHCEMLRTLTNMGADHAVVDINGLSCLHHAAGGGNDDAVRLVK